MIIQKMFILGRKNFGKIHLHPSKSAIIIEVISPVGGIMEKGSSGPALGGAIWFIGWLFTISYAHLV